MQPTITMKLWHKKNKNVKQNLKNHLKMFHIYIKKAGIEPAFIFKLTSFSCSFSCCFAFLLSLYAWFFISFFLSYITNNAVFLAFSFKSFKRAFKRFVFANLDCCQLSHHLLFSELLKRLYSFL